MRSIICISGPNWEPQALSGDSGKFINMIQIVFVKINDAIRDYFFFFGGFTWPALITLMEYNITICSNE